MTATMPDPFTPPSIESEDAEVIEIPVREVLARLASLIGGPLTEYVTAELNEVPQCPARRALAFHLHALSSEADAIVDAWDCLADREA